MNNCDALHRAFLDHFGGQIADGLESILLTDTLEANNDYITKA